MVLNPYIEHTNLRPDITGGDVERLIEEAIEHKFLGICIPPFWVKKAARDIGKRACRLITVAGFPLGFQMTEVKIREIEIALEQGADEIDLVWHISAFRSGMMWPKIELAKCSNLVHNERKLLKVIIETSLLSNREIIRACGICRDAGADFVKTSTGFGAAGATVEHVRVMRESLPDDVGVKASGGIKTAGQATKLILAGANRIGTSSGISIVS